jgi:hypothetical protein
VKVKEGDHLDFVTDCRANVAFDSFHWAPVLRYGGGATRATNGVRTEWNAKTDFTGPPKPRSTPLSPWVKYAQVLLLSNELMFVD